MKEDPLEDTPEIRAACEKWFHTVQTPEEEKLFEYEGNDFSLVTFRAGWLAAMAHKREA